MLTNKKIALFMDVDNVAIDKDEYQSALYQLGELGEILYGKVYGITDRKNKEISNSVLSKGYEVSPPLRVKKRGSKVFDYRIIVDIMEKVLQNNTVDTVAIFAAPTDLTWLYAKLRAYGISIIALDNNDEENAALVHQLMDIGIVEKLKPLKKAPTVPAQPKEKPQEKPQQKAVKEEVKKEEEVLTAPLMDTINKILAEAESEQPKEEVKETVSQVIKPVAQEKPVIKETPKSQKAFDEVQVLKEVENIKNTPKIVDDENAELLEKIRKLIEDYRNE